MSSRVDLNLLFCLFFVFDFAGRACRRSCDRVAGSELADWSAFLDPSRLSLDQYRPTLRFTVCAITVWTDIKMPAIHALFTTCVKVSSSAGTWTALPNGQFTLEL